MTPSPSRCPADWAEMLDPAALGAARQAEMRIAEEALSGKEIFPPAHQRLVALELTKFHDVRVVLLGQDPYHGPRQAHGLAFSVLAGNATPPSLRNILRELHADQGCTRHDTNLSDWARQGVLLLNRVLSVERGKPKSHARIGWESFTAAAVRALAMDPKPKVFMLWGDYAQELRTLIPDQPHMIIETPHPSPLSAYRGFFGSRPFSRANEFLCAHGGQPVTWG